MKIQNLKYDLETLNNLQFAALLYSDGSTHSLLYNLICEKIKDQEVLKVPEGSELYCSNCKEFTTYEKSLTGTIQLTENYKKDITVCPNCLVHSVLSDCT